MQLSSSPPESHFNFKIGITLLFTFSNVRWCTAALIYLFVCVLFISCSVLPVVIETNIERHQYAWAPHLPALARSHAGLKLIIYVSKEQKLKDRQWAKVYQNIPVHVVVANGSCCKKMGEELDPAVIEATQQKLGKFIQKPQLTDKLLKRPPFRFLHDIVTVVSFS